MQVSGRRLAAGAWSPGGRGNKLESHIVIVVGVGEGARGCLGSALLGLYWKESQQVWPSLLLGQVGADGACWGGLKKEKGPMGLKLGLAKMGQNNGP